MATFTDYLKNIFYLLLFLQLTPILIRSIKRQYGDLFEAKTKIGIVSIKGTLYEAGPSTKELKKIFEDPEIRGVLLKIDSPGGVSGAAQTIFNEINYFKENYPDKYVVCFVENIAASGGYYVACAANYIISSPSAFIGSIGSYIQHPLFKDFIEKYNIKYELIKTGAYKGAGNPLLELTPEQKTQFQGLTNDVYKQFVRDVRLHRPHLSTNTEEWADGRIFTGEQALALKLVDEVGSPSSTLRVFRELGHIEGKIEWVKPEKRSGLLKAIFSGEADDDDEPTYLSSFVKSVCNVIEARYSSHISC